MHRARYVSLPLVLLVATVPGFSSASWATSKPAPRATSCFLSFDVSNPITCYPASATTQLSELKIHPVFNPAPTVSQLTHLRLRQVMVVGQPSPVSVPIAFPYPKGIYFPFGRYVHPHHAIPVTSPAKPKWLVLMEAQVDAPDSIVQWRMWGPGGVSPNGNLTDVQSIDAWARHGSRSFVAVSNEPIALIKKVLLALLTAQG